MIFLACLLCFFSLVKALKLNGTLESLYHRTPQAINFLSAVDPSSVGNLCALRYDSRPWTRLVKFPFENLDAQRRDAMFKVFEKDDACFQYFLSPSSDIEPQMFPLLERHGLLKKLKPLALHPSIFISPDLTGNQQRTLYMQAIE